MGHFQGSLVGWEVFLFFKYSLLMYFFCFVFLSVCYCGIFDILLSKFPEM